PDGATTTYHFEYGPTTSYGTSTGSLNVGPEGRPQAVQAVLHGLVGEGVYHYRLVATSSLGTSTGSDHTFTVLGARAAAVVDAGGRTHLFFRAPSGGLEEWSQSGSLWRHR